MSTISAILREMIETRLSESASLTNGEALKIGKLAKKKAEQIRKTGGSLADKDATRLELLADAIYEAWMKGMSGEEAFEKKSNEIISNLVKSWFKINVVEKAFQNLKNDLFGLQYWRHRSKQIMTFTKTQIMIFRVLIRS